MGKIHQKKYIQEQQHRTAPPSDVFGEQKSGSGLVRGLLFGFELGSGINISGMSPSGFWGFGDFKGKI